VKGLEAVVTLSSSKKRRSSLGHVLVLKRLHAVSLAVTGGTSWRGLLLFLTIFSPVVQPAEKAYDMYPSFFA
jgi:hypothetical protein